MRTIRFGLGFATGRKNFRKVLNAYISTWNAVREKYSREADVRLSLFVAYDLEYHNTKSTDYTNLSQEIVDVFDDIVFLGAKNILKSIERLKIGDEFSSEELKSVFGAGYAGKRNAILFAALDNQIDYLMFLDDDEYPVAVTNNHDICLWSGQHILSSHLESIPYADFTNGHHCGYISPIPQIKFNEVLSEKDFETFINAVSNDIISWEKIKKLVKSGGVTYASTDVLAEKKVEEVLESGGCKFISGANLCINLTQPERTLPFYNPPGARGEDTFLSTLLHDCTVNRIPCYTFHDGFSIYQNLLDGALPTALSPITGDSSALVSRFLNACIGWVRYKPLLVYITAPDRFEQQMQDMREALGETLPKLAAYFKNERFMTVLTEFEKYNRNVKKHFEQFATTKNVWKKLMTMLEEENQNGRR